MFYYFFCRHNLNSSEFKTVKKKRERQKNTKHTATECLHNLCNVIGTQSYLFINSAWNRYTHWFSIPECNITFSLYFIESYVLFNFFFFDTVRLIIRMFYCRVDVKSMRQTKAKRKAIKKKSLFFTKYFYILWWNYNRFCFAFLCDVVFIRVFIFILIAHSFLMVDFN